MGASIRHLGVCLLASFIGACAPANPPPEKTPSTAPSAAVPPQAGQAAEPSYPCTIQDFIARAPRKVGHMALVYSDSEWAVFLRDGAVMVAPAGFSDVVGPRPPFQPRDEESPFPRGACYTLKVDDGWLVGFNRGEFGASLWWFSESGKDKYRIGDDQVSVFMRMGDSIYALEGLAHLSSDVGRICHLVRDKEGKWTSEPFVTLHEAPDAAVLDRDGAMIVVTTNSVVKVWPSGKMRLLVHSDWVYANSAVLAEDGTLYIGKRGAVAQVIDLDGTPKVTVIERAYAEEHAREAKEEGLLSSIAEGLKSPDSQIRAQALRAIVAASADVQRDRYNETFINTPDYDVAMTVVPALKDPSPEVRLESARILAALPHVAATPALGEALNDPDEAVAIAAGVSLGRLGKDAAPFLAGALGSSRTPVAVQAARSLGGMGGDAQEALQPLHTAAADSRPEVAAAARQAIADIGNVAEPAIATLADPAAAAEARSQAASTLGILGMVSVRVLPALLAAMKDKDPEVRRWVCWALGELGPEAAPDAAPVLIAAFKDPADAVPEVAAEALARLGPACCPRLIESLRSEDAGIRRQAANALFWMGKKAVPAVAALTAALDDKAAEVRAKSAAALGQIGPAASQAIPRLIALLDDPDKDSRKRCADALADIDPTRSAVVQALRKTVRDPDPEVRWRTVCALRVLKPVPPEVVPILIDAVNGEDEEVGGRAAEILRKIRPLPLAAIPALVKALERLVGSEKVDTIGVLGGRGGSMICRLARTLGQCGPAAAPAVPTLIKTLQSENVHLRMAAAEALGEIGPSAGDAVPALRGALDSRDLRLILAAEKALKAIQSTPAHGDAGRE